MERLAGQVQWCTLDLYTCTVVYYYMACLCAFVAEMAVCFLVFRFSVLSFDPSPSVYQQRLKGSSVRCTPNITWLTNKRSIVRDNCRRTSIRIVRISVCVCDPGSPSLSHYTAFGASQSTRRTSEQTDCTMQQLHSPFVAVHAPRPHCRFPLAHGETR